MTAETTGDPLLEVESLEVHYDLSAHRWGRRRRLVAVRGVSFRIDHGEVLALVGESGCGKSSIGRAIAGIEPIAAGHVRFGARDVATVQGRKRKTWRRQLSMVFQDPYASLNPRLRVEHIIAEPLKAHDVPRDRQRDRVHELLELVGLPPTMARRFPVSLSGGQRQRVAIARALALDPSLLIADEPVSALDVSAQAQLLNLLQELRERLDLSILLVSHDLWMVRSMADRVAVMYLGNLVETGPVEQVFDDPRHPYTQALLTSAPLPDPIEERARERIVLEGEVPSPLDTPPGCHFAPRCPYVFGDCRLALPDLLPTGPTSAARCLLVVQETAE